MSEGNCTLPTSCTFDPARLAVPHFFLAGVVRRFVPTHSLNSFKLPLIKSCGCLWVSLQVTVQTSREMTHFTGGNCKAPHGTICSHFNLWLESESLLFTTFQQIKFGAIYSNLSLHHTLFYSILACIFHFILFYLATIKALLYEGRDKTISTTTGWIFCADIHGPHRAIPRLFILRHHQVKLFDLFNTVIYDRMPAKLITSPSASAVFVFAAN